MCLSEAFRQVHRIFAIWVSRAGYKKTTTILLLFYPHFCFVTLRTSHKITVFKLCVITVSLLIVWIACGRTLSIISTVFITLLKLYFIIRLVSFWFIIIISIKRWLTTWSSTVIWAEIVLICLLVICFKFFWKNTLENRWLAWSLEKYFFHLLNCFIKYLNFLSTSICNGFHVCFHLSSQVWLV